MHQPAVLFCGVADPVVRPDALGGYEDNAPKMRIEVVEDAGHWLPEEAPETLLEGMLGALRAPGLSARFRIPMSGGVSELGIREPQNGRSSPSRWRRIMCIATLTERSRTSSRLPGSFGSRASTRPSADLTQMQT